MSRTHRNDRDEQRTIEHPAEEDPLSFVRTLTKTRGLVERLRDGPAHRPGIATDLGVSKSTAYNWTRELENHGLVEKTSEGYRLTAVGRLQTQLFGGWQQASAAGAVFVDVLTDGDAEPPLALFADGELSSVSSVTSPAVVNWLGGASTVGFLGTPTLLWELPCVDEVVADDATLEFVHRDDFDDERPDFVEDVETSSTSNIRCLRASENVPFGLICRMTPTPGVAVVRETADDIALLTADDSASVDWAANCYQNLRPDDVETPLPWISDAT